MGVRITVTVELSPIGPDHPSPDAVRKEFLETLAGLEVRVECDDHQYGELAYIVNVSE